MNLRHWQPFGNLTSMHNRFHRLFEDDFFKDFGINAVSDEGPQTVKDDCCGDWFPAADIFETKDDYVVNLEVPGISKEDINIEFVNNTLSIKGERKEEKEVEEENYHRVERFNGAFNRSFTLPGETDGNKINASMKDGILELRIPKAAEKKIKSIPINVK